MALKEKGQRRRGGGREGHKKETKREREEKKGGGGGTERETAEEKERESARNSLAYALLFRLSLIKHLVGRKHGSCVECLYA